MLEYSSYCYHQFSVLSETVAIIMTYQWSINPTSWLEYLFWISNSTCPVQNMAAVLISHPMCHWAYYLTCKFYVMWTSYSYGLSDVNSRFHTTNEAWKLGGTREISANGVRLNPFSWNWIQVSHTQRLLMISIWRCYTPVRGGQEVRVRDDITFTINICW